VVITTCALHSKSYNSLVLQKVHISVIHRFVGLENQVILIYEEVLCTMSTDTLKRSDSKTQFVNQAAITTFGRCQDFL